MPDPEREEEEPTTTPVELDSESTSDTEPALDLTEEEEHAVGKHRLSWFSTSPKAKKWVSLAAKIGGAMGLIVMVWKGVLYIDDVHETIQDNADTVEDLSENNRKEHRRLRKHMNRMVKATQRAQDKDKRVITQLRIAIAAMQAADRVRHGEGSYSGVNLDPSDGGGSHDDDTDPLAEVHINPEPPHSYHEKREQVEKAHEDAQKAVKNAAEIQMEADDDPLSGLEGL